MSDSATAVKRNLVIMSLLIIAFALPIVVARYIYFHPDKFTLTKHRNGIVLHTPINVNALFPSATYGKYWKIFYVPKNCCDTQCNRITYKLNQIKTNLNADGQWINFFVIKPDYCEINESDNVTPVSLSDEENEEFSAALGSNLPPQDNALEGHLYVVDGDGNLLMYYPEDVNTVGLRNDVNKFIEEVRSAQ